jgi:hypothetical protein
VATVRTIAEVAGQELVWVQPSRMQQAFELHAAGELVATLRFERGSLAAAETAGDRWTFKREGFWRPQVTVRLPSSDTNLAVFKPSWTGGGTLELSSGQVFRFGAANFWHSQWDWQDTESESLLQFKSHAGILKMEGQVEVEPGAHGLTELPLLVALGWYLLILFARDAAAASAGSTAAITSTGS